MRNGATPSLCAADFAPGDTVEYERGYGDMSAPLSGTVRAVGLNWLRIADAAGETRCISVDATVRRVEGGAGC